MPFDWEPRARDWLKQRDREHRKRLELRRAIRVALQWLALPSAASPGAEKRLREALARDDDRARRGKRRR